MLPKQRAESLDERLTERLVERLAVLVRVAVLRWQGWLQWLISWLSAWLSGWLSTECLASVHNGKKRGQSYQRGSASRATIWSTCIKHALSAWQSG